MKKVSICLKRGLVVGMGLSVLPSIVDAYSSCVNPHTWVHIPVRINESTEQHIYETLLDLAMQAKDTKMDNEGTNHACDQHMPVPTSRTHVDFGKPVMDTRTITLSPSEHTPYTWLCPMNYYTYLPAMSGARRIFHETLARLGNH
jgi:hypothetical protein